MENKQFRAILREEIQASLQELLPSLIRQTIKEQMLPIVKAMINERKQNKQTSNYITEIKKGVKNAPTPMQPASYPGKPGGRVSNTTNPIAHLIHETFNQMSGTEDAFDDYFVPGVTPIDGEVAQAMQIQQPGMQVPYGMPVQGQLSPQIMQGPTNPILEALAPKITGPVSTVFNPEADIDNVEVPGVPDFTKLMSNRTFK